MTISPDTDALYNEAIAVQARVEEYSAKETAFRQLHRDEELRLLSNGFLPDAAPEIRLRAVSLRANQIMQEQYADLYKWLDEEGASLAGTRARNEGIVAAGWAEQFAYNVETRRLAAKWDKPKGELEA